MGHAWVGALHESSEVTLAGVVDLDMARARAVAEKVGPNLAVGADVAAVVRESDSNVLIDVTSPAAHLPVTLEALSLGMPVLGEKPLAANVAEALVLVAASQAAGELVMVSQSRRYNRQLQQLKSAMPSLGEVAIVTTEFFRAPRFGGFRDEMEHPLLLDMAIHQFDTARYLLDAQPVAVYCEEFNPAWSWYAGAASATAVFEMESAQRYIYTGSWCSPGLETSWNGCWRVSGVNGSALWDGDSSPTFSSGEIGDDSPNTWCGDGIAGALSDFVSALRTGQQPMGQAHDNVLSLAMVEAAIESATTGRRVALADVLDRALERACGIAPPGAREVLRSWTSVHEGLGIRYAPEANDQAADAFPLR